jgi:hypothetical protein
MMIDPRLGFCRPSCSKASGGMSSSAKVLATNGSGSFVEVYADSVTEVASRVKTDKR